MNNLTKTTCPYCGVGCGILAQALTDSRELTISGDEVHPANYGRLCSKGTALADTVGLEGRLLTPHIHGRACDWEEALALVAAKFSQIIAEYGPDAVAFYGSGQLLTEDYYVANKLMKGFIGSGNIDTNSRLCMSSSVAGHKRAFGSDTIPGCYEDLELAELIIFVGANSAWCHPVIYQRIKAAKKNNPNLKIVVIDPRRTPTCEIADLHLPLAIGTDVALWNGLLAYLHQSKKINSTYINDHTEGWSAVTRAIESGYDVVDVALRCGLPYEAVETFNRWFAEHEKVVTLFSQGVNQSSSGTDKVNAIINCHLATGRIGKPGMGPFSLTGQPNAMGGREVGGLAHQLAAHMDFKNPEDVNRIARFWGSKNIAETPGLPAVELFDAIYDGKIKAVWIMGTNPVVSMPNADKVKQALAQCEFVVVSDCIANTDTTELAHVLLPAQGWSEKDGTVTNSERCISRQRTLLKPAGMAKPDWWIISQIGQRLGFQQAFDYKKPADIFREHSALSGFENNEQQGLRDFDISGLAKLSDEEYDKLSPMQWPINANHPQGCKRLFSDNQFFTQSGKAQLIPVECRAPANKTDEAYPLILNTGRIRDQWHTMTRTALSAKLNQHKPEAFVEIHPDDAKSHHLAEDDLAEIESAWGKQLARVVVTDEQQRGNLFIPMHWSNQFAKQARVGALVNPSFDPHSKQPELKHTPVRIQAFKVKWYGFILSRNKIKKSDLIYWSVNQSSHCFRYELADSKIPENWQQWSKHQLGFSEGDGLASWQEFQDTGHGDYRSAHIKNNRIESLIFISSNNMLPERCWLISLFEKQNLDKAIRKSLLSGIPPEGEIDEGNIVCTCFNVGAKNIKTAINTHHLRTVQDISKCLKVGGNCGSCLPEIKTILQSELSKLIKFDVKF
jgi:assimilatory nitrate reductase catalytic subunit